MHRFLKTNTGKDVDPSPTKRPRLNDMGELPPVAQQHTFLDLAKKRDWAALKASLATTPTLINVQPLGRWTALHQAASAGHADTVAYLLECSADMNLRTADSKKPIEVASTDAVIALLKAAECKQASESITGRSPIPKKSDLGVELRTDRKNGPVEVSSKVIADQTKSHATAVWQVKPTSLPTEWVDMGCERQALLHDAKNAGIPKAIFRDGGRSYIVDLEKYTQTDYSTGDECPIRLVSPSTAALDSTHSSESKTSPDKSHEDVKEVSSTATSTPMVDITDGDKLDVGQTIEVAGSGAKPYIVKNCGGGVWSCTCVNWKMQGKLPTNQRSCKHIVSVRGAEAEKQRLANSAVPVADATLPKKAIVTSAASSEMAEGGKASPPALLLANKWEEHVDPSGWWISEKLDGMRAYWDPDKQCLLSRLGNPILCPKHILAGLPDVALDGELFLGRGRFQELMSVVKNSANFNRVDGPWKDVVYIVFDMPKHGGKFENRMETLKSRLGATMTNFAKYHEHQVCKSPAHLEEELKKIQAQGGEGLMLRRAGSLYESGRSNSLLKVKTFQDEEAVVIGHEPGKGRNSAVTGALRCRNRTGIEFSVGSGLNDAQRANPPKVGEIITFRFFELTKDNKPRFPSFVGVRADADRTGLGI